ncbi:MAG: TonB-dependent receptor [Magnetospirillum sp.]|nr:TonB-dependent receptor [Magnetospirillum sp.]
MSVHQQQAHGRPEFSQRHWRGVSLAALVVALTCGGSALAAEDEVAQAAPTQAPAAVDGSSGNIEEIVVTARRREEKAQDVPIPITVIGGDDLANKGTVRIEDIGRLLPSTNVTYSNPRQNSVAVRGLGNNPANEGLESSVGLFVDGVYYSRPGMGVIELTDLEQVELLRGPQGTLFGKNTTGGALNITTKRPTFTPGVTGEASYGSYNERAFRASVNGGITDTQAVRVSLYDTRRDGILQGLARPDQNDRERQGVRGQWLFDNKENFDLRLIADYHQEDDQQGVSSQAFRFTNRKQTYLTNRANLAAAAAGAGQTLLAPDGNYNAWDRTSFANDSYEKKVHQGGASAEANWKFGDGYNLTSLSAFRRWDFRPYNDGDNLNLNVITNSGGEVLANQISQEIRLSSPTGNLVDYTTGLYYYLSRQKYHNFSEYGDNAAILNAYGYANRYVGKQVISDAQLGTDSYAAFGQANVHATDALTITPGARYTYERKNIVANRDLDGTSLTLPDTQVTEENVKSYSLTALLAADYKVNDNLNLFTSVSHGAKAGATNATYPTGASLNRENLIVRPEKINAVELGFKSRLLDRRATLNGNIYYEVVRDYQAQGQVWNPATNGYTGTLVNTGWVDTKGAELEGSYKPLPGLTLRSGLSYNLAKYRSYRNGACAPENNLPGGSVCDLSGRDVQGAPRWIGSVGADYTQEVEDGIEAYVGTDFTFRSGSFGTNDNSEFGRIDGYGLVNLFAGTRLNDGQIDVQLWVRNLFDKEYVNSTGIGSQFWTGTYSANLGDPRTVGVTGKVKF